MGYKDYLNPYSFECELPGTGQQVKIKPITTGQIKQLLVHENETNPIIIEQAFDELIKSSVLTEDFNIDDIYIKDREFLLIELRKRTKGEKYQFEFKCPKCKSDNINVLNFNNLTVNKKPELQDNSINVFDNLTIYVDHVLRGEQKEAYSYIEDVENKPLNVLRSQMALNTVACGIKKVESPDGIEDKLSFEDKTYLLNSLPYQQFEQLKNWFEENNFGVNLTFQPVCTNCKYKLGSQNISLDSNFF